MCGHAPLVGLLESTSAGSACSTRGQTGVQEPFSPCGAWPDESRIGTVDARTMGAEHAPPPAAEAHGKDVSYVTALAENIAG